MENKVTILNNRVKSGLIMQQAEAKDTVAIISLLRETAKWFQAKGSTQWNGLLGGVDTHDTKSVIVGGEVFICMNHDELVGLVILLKQPSLWDQNLWQLTKDDRNEAVYLHRLAINRKYEHQNIGEAILNWCKYEVDFEGKKKLRLDCIADNPFLNNFYRKAGFNYIKENNGYALYEFIF